MRRRSGGDAGHGSAASQSRRQRRPATRCWRNQARPRWGPGAGRPAGRAAGALGVLGARPGRHHPQRRHRQHQPVARHPRRVGPPRPLPLPAHPLERPEAQLHPRPEAVPGDARPPGRQIGQQHPGPGLARGPHHHQRPGPPGPPVAEGHPAPDPGVAGARDERPGAAAVAPGRGEGRRLLHAQQRLPAEVADALPQPQAPQAAVGQHQHRHRGGDRRPQQAQEPQGVGQPGAGLVGRQDVPGDRERRAAVQHADDEGDDPVAVGGGVDGQGQVLAAPPGQHPAQQGGEARGHLELGPAGGGLVRPVVGPLAQVLAQAMPGPERQQGRDDGRLAGAAGQHRPVHPQRQAAPLGRAQHRQALRQRRLHLIASARIAHVSLPHDGRFSTAIMPGARALSARSEPLPTLVNPHGADTVRWRRAEDAGHDGRRCGNARRASRAGDAPHDAPGRSARAGGHAAHPARLLATAARPGAVRRDDAPDRRRSPPAAHAGDPRNH
jgi:hypothetical protein